MPTTPPSTPNTSRYKRKNTDCFNDPAFIKLFSQVLRLDVERLNPNSTPNPSPSSQVGLATPPDTLINLPDVSNASGSTVVGSCNGTTAQALAPIQSVPEHPRVSPPAENTTSVFEHSRATPPAESMTHVPEHPRAAPPAGSMTPNSRANRKNKKKFYVVTRGRRTGVFNSWLIVEPLVNRIPGNCHASFDSYELALEEYEAAKVRGDLCVIWLTVEDRTTYGPEKRDAMM